MRWHPFLLRPDTPPEGQPLSAILPARYLAAAHERLAAVAREANLPLKYPQWVPNTHRAHEAAMVAEAAGRGDAFHRRVLTAHFAEERNIGDPAVLAELGDEVGVDPAAIHAALAAGTYRDAVDEALEGAQALGVQAVPTFVFGERFGFSGAQPIEAFEQALAALDRC